MTPDQIARLPYRPCVGVMLLNARGHVFVGQRNDQFGDAWQMPQGGVEKGETPREAGLRELEEETGVTPDLVEVLDQTQDWLTYDLPHDVVPKIWQGRYRGQKQIWFLMRYSGRDDQVNIATLHPEFTKWRWLDTDLLVDSIVPFKRALYSSVLSAFSAHLPDRPT
jgi:putative (di)nucleoside polyphosphate hydrolase